MQRGRVKELLVLSLYTVHSSMPTISVWCVVNMLGKLYWAWIFPADMVCLLQVVWLGKLISTSVVLVWLLKS